MGQRILVFESDRDFAAELKQGFGDLGVDVEVIADGAAGLERAQAAPPDLVLLSAELPTVSGYMICKKLRKDERLKGVPVVVLSSAPNAEQQFAQHKGLPRARADEYIRKPIGFDDLLARVRPLVKLPESSSNGRAGRQFRASSGAKPKRDVDAEIDAFAESAFDALQMREGDSTTVANVADVRAALARSEDSGVHRSDLPEPPGGARESLAELDIDVLDVPEVPPRPSSRATAPSVDATEPAVSVASADGERISGEHAVGLSVANAELESARSEIRDLQAEIELLRARADRADRLERDIAELQAKAAKGGGVSSRDFLDLRESLNRKDKEILDLKDQLSTRDKQTLEMREKNLALERAKADVQDNVLAFERKLADSEDQVAGLTADKTAAAKRAEDLKSRLDRAEAKAKKFETDLEAARQAHAADVQRAQKKAAEDLAAEKSAHEEARIRAAGEHAAALEELKASHAAAVAQAEEGHAADRGRLIAKHEGESERLRKDHEAAASAAAEAHAAELREAHEAAEQAKTDALDELRRELMKETDGKLAELRDEHSMEMERAERDHKAEVERKLADLAGAHRLEVDEVKQEHSRELAVLSRKLTEAERGLAETRAKLESTETERARLESDLGVCVEERDTAREAIALAQSQVEELEKETQTKGERIQNLDGRLTDVEARLGRATAKISSDEEILERARRAATIALGLLEAQQKARLE